jgi:hypothetical protein
MSTAIVLYERWAVDDPVLDCAIQIIDTARYREALEDEYPDDCGGCLDYDYEPSMLIDDAYANRPIDQINCNGCGRPMVVWADEPLASTLCSRCRSGLTPEWEY